MWGSGAIIKLWAIKPYCQVSSSRFETARCLAHPQTRPPWASQLLPRQPPRAPTPPRRPRCTSYPSARSAQSIFIIRYKQELLFSGLWSQTPLPWASPLPRRQPRRAPRLRRWPRCGPLPSTSFPRSPPTPSTPGPSALSRRPSSTPGTRCQTPHPAWRCRLLPEVQRRAPASGIFGRESMSDGRID